MINLTGLKGLAINKNSTVLPCQSGRDRGKAFFLVSLRSLLDPRLQGPLDSSPPHGLRPESGSSGQTSPRGCPFPTLTSRVDRALYGPRVPCKLS